MIFLLSAMGTSSYIVRFKAYRPVLAGLVFAFLVTSPPAVADEFVLVVNSKAGVSKLDIRQARRILSGRTASWPNGVPVTVVLAPAGSGPMRWLASHVVRMPETSYRRYLQGQAFRGQAKRPIETGSLKQTQARIRTISGAVTALPKSMVVDGLVGLVLE